MTENIVIDWPGVLTGLAALVLAIWTVAGAVMTTRQKKAIDDADAALKYEETATKAAERALKLQDRVDKLEKLTQSLVAENAQLKEYIYRLEGILIAAGIDVPTRPIKLEEIKQ